MALTPEDVVNKRFESTKFREGYDQDDVDDFLDEVVVELRRLNQENQELRQRVSAAEARSADAQSAASTAQQAPAQAAAPAALESAPAPAMSAAPVESPASSLDDASSSTNNLLQLARRLHEEHVREGVQKRDALIAEGQASAAEIVADAEAQQRARLGSLEQERNEIESRIESLRTFEREYRDRLKSYIEGQLHELDSDSLVAASAPSGAEANVHASAPAAQPTGQLSPEDFAAPQSAQQPPASFTGFSGS